MRFIMNIYEVHVGASKQHIDEKLYSFKDLTSKFITYLKIIDYKRLEFMSIMGHPLDVS